MTNLKLSDLHGYSGIDKSNDISLYEYGLLINDNDINDIHCYYGIGSNDGCNYDTFDCGNISGKEIIALFYELNKAGLLSYTGINESDWLNMSPVNQISDLLSYFGYENIFGTSYNSFEIDNN
jgi:hypothetical protein